VVADALINPRRFNKFRSLTMHMTHFLAVVWELDL
jgi:hypothetical protein